MDPGRHLTGCAASGHPDPAVAVGEVVGRLQNSLAGSPQFALVLVDLRIGSFLSTIASAVHRLLGPDLALAVSWSHVAGADHLGPSRAAAVVVWALCGVDVDTLGGAESPGPTGGPTLMAMHEAAHGESDGTVSVEFRLGPDAPRPMFIGGDGRRWRPPRPGFRLPAGTATLVRGRGECNVGTVMEATDARGRTLRRLDHVPARAILLDQLETTEAFVDGPSLEFPPLRAAVRSDSGPRRLIDVIAVDPEDGSVELADDVEVGDRVQLLAWDPDVAARRVAERLLQAQAPGDRAVLVDGDLSSANADDTDPIPTAAVQDVTATGGIRRRPWSGVSALSVHIVDDD